MRVYNDRVWLNSKNDPSSGSLVIFSGPIKWNYKMKRRKTQFLELSDCHGKVRLHQTHEQSDKKWIKKMKLLKKSLDNYIKYLEKNND